MRKEPAIDFGSATYEVSCALNAAKSMATAAPSGSAGGRVGEAVTGDSGIHAESTACTGNESVSPDAAEAASARPSKVQVRCQ